jgi:hypothetical protein
MNALLRNKITLMRSHGISARFILQRFAFSRSAVLFENKEQDALERFLDKPDQNGLVHFLGNIAAGNMAFIEKLRQDNDALWRKREALLREKEADKEALFREKEALLREKEADKVKLLEAQEALKLQNASLVRHSEERARLLLVVRRTCDVRGALEFIRAQVPSAFEDWLSIYLF